MSTFLDLPDAILEDAQVVVVPLPWEGSVSYGSGAALAPEAIWRASAQVELWDQETDTDLDTIPIHNALPIEPFDDDSIDSYLARVEQGVYQLHAERRLVVGVGGDHSLTPPLLRAACRARAIDPSTLTILHVDAHADLRIEYNATPNSHACAMARALDMGTSVISVGVRSEDREEHDRGVASTRVHTYRARDLHNDPTLVARLHDRIASLTGPLYITIDVDALEVHLCPSTGTPEPGGLSWWFTLDLLKRAIANPNVTLIGADVVETVPMQGSSVNEDVAARLVAKLMTYSSEKYT
ncbi:MAG: agmatinase [Planctomycetota bacterium]|jgi:agmatinase